MFKSFADEVKELCKTKSCRGVARNTIQIGKLIWSETAIVNWIKGRGKFPKNAAVSICKVLELPYANIEEIEAAYPGTQWGRESDSQAPENMTALLAEIDDAQRSILPGLTHLGNLTRQLFAHMDHRHFFASTMTTIAPLIFKDEGMVSDRCKAVANGLLYAMIIPTKEAMMTLQENMSAITVSHSEFTNGFEAFRCRLRDVLISRGESKDEAYKHSFTRAQLIQWDIFPVTPPEYSVSLFGELHPDGSPVLRVILRNPEQPVSLIPFFRTGLHPLCRRLFEYIGNVMSKVSLQTERVIASDADAGPQLRWKADFIRAFQQRMAGNKGDYQI